MKKIYIVTLLVIVCAFKVDDLKVFIKDFSPVFGQWTGSLTYLDYTSGKPYKMPANVTIALSASNNNQLILVYEYPKEPKANGNDTLTIAASGLQIDDHDVVSKKIIEGNKLQITTTESGKDGNDHKPAIIKRTYTIGKNIFSIKKEVEFLGTADWFLRDIFLFEK